MPVRVPVRGLFRRGRPGCPRGRLERRDSRGLAPPLAGGLNDGSDGSSAMAAPQAHERLLGSRLEAAAGAFPV